MATVVRMPRLTSSMMEGTIERWLRREGEAVVQGQPLLVVESDKAAVEVDAPASGTLLKVTRPAGDTVEVDGAIGLIGVPGEETAEPRPPTDESPVAATTMPVHSQRPSRRVNASPAARRLAAERGIDLSTVTGTGPGGMIVEEDLLASAGRAAVSPFAASPYGRVTEVPLSPIQRAMSERMMLSHQQVVQGTTFADVDMSSTLERKRAAGASVTAMVARAVVIALLEHPLMNSSLRDEGLLVPDYVNLGVAVATDRGLLVPVVHNAEKLDLARLSAAIDALADRARWGSLAPKEMSDGTFTITNSGAMGALAFAPIVSYPESAILGMGKVMETPAVRDGAIVARPMIYLSVSYNHRFIDGASAVTFLQRVKALLENPADL